MSLFEAGYSDGKISLKDICYGRADDVMTGEVNLKDLIDFILRGGWPDNWRSTEYCFTCSKTIYRCYHHRRLL